MFKRIAGAVAVLALAGLGGLLLAGPAQAAEVHYPAAGWEVRQISLGDLDWSPASASTVVDATTVALTKPDGLTGTSVETTDLGLAADAGTDITVSYTLDGGADVAAGAVRMFYYDTADADTLHVGPAAFVAADGSGTLTLTVAVDVALGTFGLVYDASNGTAGTVTFTDLTVGATTVLFVAPPVPCEWDDQLAADDDLCQEPLASPSPTPAADESPAPAGAASSGDSAQLPVTSGVLVPALLVTGAGAAAAGGLVLLAQRMARRPARFVAE